MGRASQKFDQGLFTRKLSELSREMQIKSEASYKMRSAASRGTSRSVLLNIVDCHLALLRDGWLKGVDRIAREVWQIQREALTPDFVRDVLVPKAMTLIGDREGVIKSSVARAHRMRFEYPNLAQHHLAREIRKLTGEVANRYEIEARELEYQKASAAQSGPQSQLDEPGGIRGLIEDATRDTTLWLQADPSAEERARVLAIQERLADLARIIERRMECRGSPEDDRQWSEVLGEVLALLEKAREARGNIVGRSLDRLAERMPRELPGPEVRRVTPAPAALSTPQKTRTVSTGIIPGQFAGLPASQFPRPKLPPPIKPVNTSEGIWLGPPAAQKHYEPEVAMKYPGDFPAESRAKVEATRIRAGRRFDSDKAKAKWKSDIEALFKSYVLTMFLAFAKEAWRLRLWPVDKTRENCEEFLRLLTIEAYFQKGKAAELRDMISNWNGSILWEFQQEIEKTPQWRKFENILLKLADGSTGSERQTESSRPQNSANSAPNVENKDRRAMVDAYIEEVRSKKKKRITRKDIWSEAGYNTRTEFERWERQDSKHPSKSADKNFTRILREKPHLK